MLCSPFGGGLYQRTRYYGVGELEPPVISSPVVKCQPFDKRTGHKRLDRHATILATGLLVAKIVKNKRTYVFSANRCDGKAGPWVLCKVVRLIHHTDHGIAVFNFKPARGGQFWRSGADRRILEWRRWLFCETLRERLGGVRFM